MRTGAIRGLQLIAGTVLYAFAFPQSHAQQLPSPIDVKAAYCRPVVGRFLDMAATGSASDSSAYIDLIAKARVDYLDRRRRLELYLLPKLGNLVPSDLLSAQKRGQEDMAKLDEVQKACNAKCRDAENLDKHFECMAGCSGEQELIERVRGCNELGWLPF